jgi:tRNA A37 threonylcarbamoyladenosine synthetase subunit TsaC/SUA5/YrdC
VLVSSANLASKTGACSPAQVRKNFSRQVEAMVDSGDLSPSTLPSTLVEVTAESDYRIHRPGAVSEEQIRNVAGH